MGWIVADPTTGSAGYFIAGSLTGIQGEASLSQGRTTPWIRAGGLTTQVTSAEDISADEAQRRKEFSNQLKTLALISLDIAIALAFFSEGRPLIALATEIALGVALVLTAAAILVDLGLLPVPPRR